MGTAPHFGKSTQQFFDAVIPDRGPKERAGVEKYLSTPFKGITTDGNVIPGLFALRSESAPTQEILQAASALLAQLSPEQKEVVCLPLESRERELWQNSIARYERFGLRLDEAPENLREAAMAVVRVKPQRRRLPEGAQSDEAQRLSRRTRRCSAAARRMVLPAAHLRRAVCDRALGLADQLAII